MKTDDLPPEQGEGSAGAEIPVLEDLLGSGLPSPAETEGLADAPEPTRAHEALSSAHREWSENARFSQDIHDYLRELIRLADQKAAFFFTGGTALLAFLDKDGLASSWVKPFQQWNWAEAIASLAVASLILSVLLAVWVVIPRTSGSRHGHIFWEAIVKHQSGREYADSVLTLSGPDLTSARAEHCFELALVCKRKYTTLRWSLVAGGVGLAATLLLFAVSRARLDRSRCDGGMPSVKLRSARRDSGARYRVQTSYPATRRNQSRSGRIPPAKWRLRGNPAQSPRVLPRHGEESYVGSSQW